MPAARLGGPAVVAECRGTNEVSPLPKKTIALINPGEMGAAVGGCLAGLGHRVLWASEGRGSTTAERARAAGLEDVGTLAAALRVADIVLAICPPHNAREVAKAAARERFQGIYVDANAVSAATTRAIGEIVEAAGARFVDGGIIGLPPSPANRCVLYLSGGLAGELAALIAGSALQVTALDGPIGAASAVKMCYAAWSKGTIALLADIRALAQSEGVEAPLLAEWQASQPEVGGRFVSVTGSARKAWRWIGEMQEIAASFAAVGLPDGFHRAAEEIYRRQARFKNSLEPPAIDAVIRAVRQVD